MIDQELKMKMDVLGSLLQTMEEKKAAFEEQTRTLSEQIEDLKNELRTEFLNRKESLASDVLVVKYRKGAVRWDSAGLNRYTKTHPELEEFRKIGEPTVAFCLRREENEENMPS